MIIFDLCGTLYNSNTTLDFLKYINPKKHKAITNKPIRLINKILIIFGYDLIRNICISSFKGLPRETLINHAESFFNQELKNKKIEWSHNQLKKLLQEGRDIYIVSATIDPIALVVAKNIGVKYISTELEYNTQKKCTGKIKIDLLGKKHLYINEQPEIIYTDNTDDLKIIKRSKKIFIISKKNKINFWRKNKSPNMEIIKI